MNNASTQNNETILDKATNANDIVEAVRNYRRNNVDGKIYVPRIYTEVVARDPLLIDYGGSERIPQLHAAPTPIIVVKDEESMKNKATNAQHRLDVWRSSCVACGGAEKADELYKLRGGNYRSW